MRAALLLEHQQRPLDGANRLLADIAVACADLGRPLRHVGEHRLQVLHVEQREAFFVGDAEGDVHHPLLRVGQVHEPRQKQRPHLGDRGADRMPLLAEQVPEDDRELLKFVGIELDRLGALEQEVLGLADHRDARQVALDVGAEHRDACIREAFGEDLQRHRLARTGGAGDKAVTICVFQQQRLRTLVRIVGMAACAKKDAVVVGHDVSARQVSCFFAGFTRSRPGIVTPSPHLNGNDRHAPVCGLFPAQRKQCAFACRIGRNALA